MPWEKKKPFDPKSLFRSMERTRRREQADEDDEELAQDLYYEAMEAGLGERQLDLLMQALELDRTNVDCLTSVLGYSELTEEEEVEALRKIVSVGESKLGAEIFKEMKGEFWGILETRPYMRARQFLVEALLNTGKLDEVVVETQGMLELNPGDNQGVRYVLLTALLTLNRLDEVDLLFEKYPECEWNTMFAWGRVLARFLRNDWAGAEEALKVARKQNSNTEAYLLGRRKLPKNLPGAYGLGSREEAICFAGDLQRAWALYPEAKSWLGSRKG